MNYGKIPYKAKKFGPPKPPPKKDDRVIPVAEDHTGAVLCAICCDYYLKKDMFHLPGCNHEYCKNCMADHLKVKVSDGQVVKIGCMDFNCKEIFTADDIKSFGSEEIYRKYLRFKENIDIEVNPNFKWCPYSPWGALSE